MVKKGIVFKANYRQLKKVLMNMMNRYIPQGNVQTEGQREEW